MRIAPDVEKLMWLAAESADPLAIADFESRFPELRYELSKRIDMVRELKSSRRLGVNAGLTPSFRPSAAPKPTFSRAKMTLAFAALSVLAFGSFYASRSLFRGAKPETPPATPSVRNGPLPTQNPAVQPIPVPPRESTAPPADANPEETPPDLQPWDKLQTIRFQKVHLQDALRAIAGQSGLQLEIAPGMPNPLIQADYRGMTGLEILADMGPQFGFTAFHQGEGQVIVIPARDATGDAPIENRTDAPDANTKLQPTRNDKPGE